MTKKILGSIWFWWILTSLVYLAFNFNQYPGESTHGIGVWNYVAAFIGLFVPYGLASGMLAIFMPSSWLSIIVFLFLMFLAQKKLNRLNLSLGKKILLNLLILLVLVTLVDLIRGTPFESWHILFRGYLDIGF